MTRRDDVDRLLVDWIAEQDRSGATYLGEVLAATQRTRQRPAWSFPGRWIPVQLTLGRVAVPRATAYLAFLAILILIALAVLAIAGSQRRLPEPFGPASNGLLVYPSSGGDIRLLDPQTGEATTLVGGPNVDQQPVFSLDGTRVAFVRMAGGTDTVLVAHVDGGQPIAVTNEPLTNVVALAWSPDGRRLAIVAGFDTARQIWLASTDGSTAPVKVDTDLIAEEVAWRPPDGGELVFRGTATPGSGYRLYIADADGTNVRQLSPMPGSDVADYAPRFSPDGKRLFYVRWDEAGGHLYTLDLAADVEAEIGPTDGRSVAAYGLSPDGARVSLTIPSLIDHGPTQLAVAASDGTGPVVDTGPEFPDVGVDHRWAPDGTVILAWHGNGTMLMYLDPGGGPARELDWPGVNDPEYQRLAP